MKILICTDGSIGSIQPAELLDKLGLAGETNVTVLGVSENIDHLENLAISMDLINKTLGSTYQLEKKIRSGNPLEEIFAEAIESSYDLVAVGGGRKQINFLHPEVGSTTSRLTRKLHTHFLVGRNVPEKLRNILFCVGPGSSSIRTMKIGASFLSSTTAKIRLLHVLPIDRPEGLPTDKIIEETPLGEVDVTAESALLTATKQLRAAGIKSEISSHMRRGLVVEEVLNEIEEGSYDLLVVGAHYQPGHDRWQGTLLDDVTDQLLNQAHCSVLII